MCIDPRRLLLLATACVAIALVPATAFGWAAVTTHPTLISTALHDPAVYSLATEFLTSDQINTISNFTGDGFSPYHGHWEEFANRAYYTDPLWAGLTDETTKICYLMHNATDSGVPLGHNPARPVYEGESGVETTLEAQVGTWLSYPTISGTSMYTGDYNSVVSQHISAVQSNAAWFKSRPLYGLFGYYWHSQGDNRTAGWAGTTQAMTFARTFLADYLLQKRPTVANAGGSYSVNPGGNVNFSAAGSQDPDSISWASNGSYSNNGGGLSEISWDLHGNGTYGDMTGMSPAQSYSQLVTAVGYTEGRTIGARVTDNEGKVAYAQANLAVYAPPVAQGRAQYGWLGKPSDVPSGWDWDNMIDNGSHDPDHTANPAAGITTWAWDLNNDGVYEKSGGSSTRIYYSDFTALGITANQYQKVTLRVTDNEGVTTTQSQIPMPVLVNPEILYLPTSVDLHPGEMLDLWGWAYDPDNYLQGYLNWAWDLDNDGVFDDGNSDSVYISYADLLAMGLHTGENTIHAQVTDDDVDVTGWWTGTRIKDITVNLYAGLRGVTLVPEPSSIAMLTTLLLAAAGIGAIRRWRRQS
jgi:hypothetical protein